MAGVKICDSCAAENAEGEPLCQCGSSSFHMPRQSVESPKTSREQAVHQRVPLTVAVLVCPWGELLLRERMLVGRDPEFSAIAVQLEAYDNVSRKHAEFSIEDRRVSVQDFQSVNGTFVNGQRIEPLVPVPLSDGDEIRFGRDLGVRLRFVE